jgi:hypothetical protein
VPASGYYNKAQLLSLFLQKMDKESAEDLVFTDPAKGVKLPESGGATILLKGIMDNGTATYDTSSV